jgi:hypothetical protein
VLHAAVFWDLHAAAVLLALLLLHAAVFWALLGMPAFALLGAV